jgi:glycosyltransferase involved in cell wall biosynthesis
MNCTRRQSEARPVVVVIENSGTPCRAAIHQRLRVELPEIDLRVAYTHTVASQPWASVDGRDEAVVSFGEGDDGDAPMTLARVVRDFRKAGRIIEWLRRESVAAVVLSGYSDLGRLRMFRWCRRHGVPVFLSADSNAHGDRARGLRRVAKNLIVRSVVRCCSAILVFGSEGARYYHRYGARDDQIVYFPSEPDYQMIESLGAAECDVVAREFSLDRQRHRFIYCGRLEAEKRPDLAVSAFVRVASEVSDWDLLVVGDGSMRQQCERLVPPELAGRVRFVGFVPEPKRLAALYHLSDVLVVPSDSEAWGLVVNEAMAAGLAVVASHVVGAIPELVYPGLNGSVFHRGDSIGLADAMCSIAQQPNVLEAMRQRSLPILRHWRRIGDPVVGLRQALEQAGVIDRRAHRACTRQPRSRRERRDCLFNGRLPGDDTSSLAPRRLPSNARGHRLSIPPQRLLQPADVEHPFGNSVLVGDGFSGGLSTARLMGPRRDAIARGAAPSP